MSRSRQRATLEDGSKVSLSELLAAIRERTGRLNSAIVTYTFTGADGRMTKRTVVVAIGSLGGGTVRISEGGPAQTVSLTSRRRHFGGRQWFFICPVTNTRAMVLWKPPGASQFASRKAWGKQVAYVSQFQTPPYRALSAAQNLRYRLAGPVYASIDDISPPRPTGMHRRTYRRKLQRLAVYEARCIRYDAILAERMEKFGLASDFD